MCAQGIANPTNPSFNAANTAVWNCEPIGAGNIAPCKAYRSANGATAPACAIKNFEIVKSDSASGTEISYECSFGTDVNIAFFDPLGQQVYPLSGALVLKDANSCGVTKNIIIPYAPTDGTVLYEARMFTGNKCVKQVFFKTKIIDNRVIPDSNVFLAVLVCFVTLGVILARKKD